MKDIFKVDDAVLEWYGSELRPAPWVMIWAEGSLWSKIQKRETDLNRSS